MRKSMIVSAGLIAMATFPAMADGYKDAPPPNRGPAALSPHEQEAKTHDENVRVVYVEREAAPVRYVSSGCGCCCQPVSYTRTYTSEPVVVRHYTRTYTRVVEPDCRHDGVYYEESRPHHHRRHHEERYYQEGSYREGWRSDDEWRRERRYNGHYSDGPVYRENSVIWSSDGSHRDKTGYTARRDEYSYYQARHE